MMLEVPESLQGQSKCSFVCLFSLPVSLSAGVERLASGVFI